MNVPEVEDVTFKIICLLRKSVSREEGRKQTSDSFWLESSSLSPDFLVDFLFQTSHPLTLERGWRKSQTDNLFDFTPCSRKTDCVSGRLGYWQQCCKLSSSLERKKIQFQHRCHFGCTLSSSLTVHLSLFTIFSLFLFEFKRRWRRTSSCIYSFVCLASVTFRLENNLHEHSLMMIQHLDLVAFPCFFCLKECLLQRTEISCVFLVAFHSDIPIYYACWLFLKYSVCLTREFCFIMRRQNMAWHVCLSLKSSKLVHGIWSQHENQCKL
jgi:hypothetical protein